MMQMSYFQNVFHAWLTPSDNHIIFLNIKFLSKEKDDLPEWRKIMKFI